MDRQDETIPPVVSKLCPYYRPLLFLKEPGLNGAIESPELHKLPAMEKDAEKPHLEILYQRVFNHFDKNGDGKISAAELRQYWYAIGMRKLAEDTEALVASLDTDGDGLLSFDHFVKLMEGENEQDRLSYLEEAIEMYDIDDFVLSDSKFCRCRTLHRWVGNFKATLVRSNRKTNRGTNLIPVSRKDLKNIALEQKLLFCTTIGKVLDISPQQHWMLLMLFGSILSYLTKNSTTSFEFQFGKTTKTPHLLLSFKEAFSAFSPEMAHITVFMLCYILSWMLVLPLEPGTQIFLVLLLLSAPLLYFPELIHRASASGVEVACGGSFTLPLIGFTTLAAIGICLIFGLLALFVVYLSWRFIHGRIPTRGQDIEVNFDDFSSLTSNG